MFIMILVCAVLDIGLGVWNFQLFLEQGAWYSAAIAVFAFAGAIFCSFFAGRIFEMESGW